MKTELFNIRTLPPTVAPAYNAVLRNARAKPFITTDDVCEMLDMRHWPMVVAAMGMLEFDGIITETSNFIRSAMTGDGINMWKSHLISW